MSIICADKFNRCVSNFFRGAYVFTIESKNASLCEFLITSMFMKKFIYTLAYLIAIVVLSSCNEAEHLAKRVQGSWSSKPQMLANEVGSQTTIIEDVYFQTDSTAVGGLIIVEGLLSVTGFASGTELDDSILQPFEVVASARSSVSGDWTAVDDDKIMVNLDMQSLKVTVNPSALEVLVNSFSEQPESMPENLRPRVATLLSSALQNHLIARYIQWTEFDDVEIREKDSILRFEIGKDKFTFYNQKTASAMQ